jgi:hypothetical protein
MKLNTLVSVLFAAVVLSWGLDLSAQSLGGGTGGLKENLDLPYDAAGDNTSDEEAPEVIVFYGQQFEGDGFYYTVDDSGSMRDSGELARAKAEISRNISEFSDRTEFSINFFDTNVNKFPGGGRPVLANPGMKGAALAWVASIVGAGGSCCQKGFLAALQSANLGSSRRKVVVYVGDGGGTCGGDESQYLNQCITLVTAQNYNHAQINTIGVLMNGRTMQENFLRAIAAANGGSYKRI